MFLMSLLALFLFLLNAPTTIPLMQAEDFE